MKNLKVVFASLLIAVMGIVGFSSFTTTSKSTLVTKTYTLNEGGVYTDPGDWTEIAPDGCPTGSSDYCSLSFEVGEEEFDINDVAPNLDDPTITSSPVVIGEHEIEFSKRALTGK